MVPYFVDSDANEIPNEESNNKHIEDQVLMTQHEDNDFGLVETTEKSNKEIEEEPKNESPNTKEPSMPIDWNDPFEDGLPEIDPVVIHQLQLKKEQHENPGSVHHNCEMCKKRFLCQDWVKTKVCPRDGICIRCPTCSRLTENLESNPDGIITIPSTSREKSDEDDKDITNQNSMNKSPSKGKQES